MVDMIPKHIIEKAIEGGYKPEPFRQRHFIRTSRGKFQHMQHASASMAYSEIVLDPLFWQSLGKALGWGNISFRQSIPAKKVRGSTHAAHIRMMRKPTPNRWKKEADRFFSLLMTGGDTEKFWADLIKQP